MFHVILETCTEVRFNLNGQKGSVAGKWQLEKLQNLPFAFPLILEKKLLSAHRKAATHIRLAIYNSYVCLKNDLNVFKT